MGSLGFNTEMPDLTDSGVPYRPEDWEDWLRWDPTTESQSPDNSSKDSSNDSPTQYANGQGDHFSWLSNDATLAPPMIVGEDANLLDFQNALDRPTYDFSQLDHSADPFVFGAADDTLQPVVDHLYTAPNAKDNALFTTPQSQTLQQPSVVPSLSLDTARSEAGNASGSGSLDSRHLSPASATHARSAGSPTSPAAEPPKKKAGRKRKVTTENQDKSSGNDSAENGEPPVKKTSHNVIEKRYRNNLNDKIMELRDSVPSLRAMSRPNDQTNESEDLEGLTPAHKLNKSTVMAKATEYIKHLEKRNKTVTDEMEAMKARLESLERAFARSSAAQDQQSAISTSPQMIQPRPSPAGQQASMQIPDHMRLHHADQQQYMQQHPTPAYEPQQNSVGARQPPQVNGQGNGLMGKLMVGSMAALMVMEGFHEHEQDSQTTSGRGLFAAPMHLFKRGSYSSGSSQGFITPLTISMFKLAVLFGAMLYLVTPMFTRKPSRKQQAPPQIRLAGIPSLASPVEIRRKAWLTAIQSVWTPRHFLVEVVSVGLRMLELSLRRVVGHELFSMISGMTKEGEAARIKAWDIAIDAQLAGGDAEVSYYRLLLTLMASGTLPDSPIRLMQKAVHFRIFFWEVANAGYGNLFMFKDFTAKVAKVYWDSARAQQRALASGKLGVPDESDGIELLPEHLAALIELDCDAVLTDEMIQRAYNLAWNRPSAENTIVSQTLDNVVEDHAIRSPLDAVAAWFTNMTIDEALACALVNGSDAIADVGYLVDLSAKTAPPASATQTRAFVTRAVLIDENREANIKAALTTVPRATSLDASDKTVMSPMLMNTVDHVPISPDVRTALTLAKLLSLASPANPAHARLHGATTLVSLPISAANMTLLTAVATHKVIDTFAHDALLFSFGKAGLESLSSSLRAWVGTRAGRSSGLTRNEKALIIDNCLGIARKLGGWKDEEVDSGYASAKGSGRGGEGIEVN